MLDIELAGPPHEQPGKRPDWPEMRVDGFLLTPGTTDRAEPLALIQLVGNGRTRSPVPDWKDGDIVTLTPLLSTSWNDAQQSGRCYLDIYIRASCKGREGWIEGLIPLNPDLYDFGQDEGR